MYRIRAPYKVVNVDSEEANPTDIRTLDGEALTRMKEGLIYYLEKLWQVMGRPHSKRTVQAEHGIVEHDQSLMDTKSSSTVYVTSMELSGASDYNNSTRSLL